MNDSKKILEGEKATKRKFEDVKFKIVSIWTGNCFHKSSRYIRYVVEAMKEEEDIITFEIEIDERYRDIVSYTRNEFLNEYKRKIGCGEVKGKKIREGDIL